MQNCNKCGKGISNFESYYHGQLAYCGICYNHGLAMYLTFEAKPYKNPEGYGIVTNITKMQKVEAEPVKEPEPIISEDTLDEVIDPLTQADPVCELDITPQKPIEPPKLELPPAPKKQKEPKTVTDAMKADCTPKALNIKRKPRPLPTEPPRRSSRIAEQKNKKN